MDWKQYPQRAGTVAIHDGVRPLASVQLINSCFVAAAQFQSAIPVVECKESLRKLEDASSKAVQRNQYKIVQTPQCFALSLIQAAYRQSYTDSFTDDATVVEALGHALTLTEREKPEILKLPHQKT